MINNRQKQILRYVSERGRVTAASIISEISRKVDRVSKPTVLRDLNALLTAGHIVRKGAGQSVYYELKTDNILSRFIDVDAYFQISPEERKIKKNFNWDIFVQFDGVFTEDERIELEKLNNVYLEKRSKLSTLAFQKEIERLTIELSWKSSELEGNTYTLIDTEILIKESREAPGHNSHEAIMILNHKRALDYIFSRSEKFSNVGLADTRGLHAILVKDLDISDDFRDILVRIVGTEYQPLDNSFQIKEALEKALGVINNISLTPAKALLAILLLSYVQPFVDGNKRTSRLLATALLIAHNWCPISWRSVDPAEYKKAMILFYEQNSLRYFKELFIKQFIFAVKNYF